MSPSQVSLPTLENFKLKVVPSHIRGQATKARRRVSSTSEDQFNVEED